MELPTPEERRARRTQPLNDKSKLILFEALGLGYSIGAACAKANLAVSTVGRHRRNDEEFASEFNDALEEGTDTLEDEARRRAVDGVPEKKYYQGVYIDTVHRYSDLLLIFMLKARRPDKYRERTQIEHIDNTGLAEKIRDARRRLAASRSTTVSEDDPLLS